MSVAIFNLIINGYTRKLGFMNVSERCKVFRNNRNEIFEMIRIRDANLGIFTISLLSGARDHVLGVNNKFNRNNRMFEVHGVRSMKSTNNFFCPW